MPENQSSIISLRLSDLRTTMKSVGLDALIVPRFDAHQGEYIAPHDERLAFVTGFTGSAGVAIVTHSTVLLFVDGRYTVQALEQCPAGHIQHAHLLSAPPETWLRENAAEGWVIGYDPMHLPPTWMERFRTAATAAGCSLQDLQDNLVDAVWDDQPLPPIGEISVFPLQFAGVAPSDKRDMLCKEMSLQSVDHYIDTQPDNIAWLLNVRGDDVAFNPMPQSFLLMDKAGSAQWFVDERKFETGLRDSLPEWVRICPKSAFLENLRSALKPRQRVLLDPDFSPTAATLAAEKSEAEIVRAVSPLSLAKAVKNPTELSGMRACHIDDGVAWAEFSAWLSASVPRRTAENYPVTEYEAEQQILTFRRQRPGFLSESFASISGAGSNAAMCHYNAHPANSAPILSDQPYLLDSGGQYETGTTDATRSFTFGTLPEGYRSAYTAVYKALHALATLRFPKGTQGHHIDAICRRPLWDKGLDYDHGTGHGIGHRLSVHEQPQRIGKPVNQVDLKAGMVLSIEPGHYVAGHYGIRIENLFEIREDESGFLRFDNLTWIPIQTDVLDLSDLTPNELEWLDQYHSDVHHHLEPFCTKQTKLWLKEACAPLQNRGQQA